MEHAVECKLILDWEGWNTL